MTVPDPTRSADNDAAISLETDILRKLYDLDEETFRARLADLYEVGHSLSDIWRWVLLAGITPAPAYSTVRAWVKSTTHPATPSDLPRPHAPARLTEHHAFPYVRATRLYVQIPPKEQEEFESLAFRVSGLRGTTPKTSPLWDAREHFENAIDLYYARGVRISDIARVARVTHRAIAMRITRRAAARAISTEIPTP